MSTRRWQVLWLAALPVACVVLYLFDPADGGFYPPCPFRTITGYDCPGCGSARAMHELTHGHIGRAFTLNPLAVLAVPVALIALVSVVRRRPMLRLPNWGPVVAVAIVVAFGVVRNLPFDAVAWMASYR